MTWCTHVNVEESVNLLLGKVEGGLVVRPPRIHDHAVQGTSLGNDLVNGSSNGGLLGHIGLDGLETARVLGLRGGKLLARLSIIDRVDDLGVVIEAGLGHTETDTTVGSGDCICQY